MQHGKRTNLVGTTDPARLVDEVIAELSAKRSDDVRWADGRTFGLVYDGGLYSGDTGAYPRASEWLQGLQDPATGAPYRPLLLDPSWWRRGAAGGGFDPDNAKYTKRAGDVVKNMENGAHDYDPFCELLVQSNPSLTPAFM